MLIALFPLVLLIFGLLIWIVSAKTVDWVTIGKVMFIVGLAVLTLISGKTTIHFP